MCETKYHHPRVDVSFNLVEGRDLIAAVIATTQPDDVVMVWSRTHIHMYMNVMNTSQAERRKMCAVDEKEMNEKGNLNRAIFS